LPPPAAPDGKSRNGTFNVLKTKGYNLEHNCGHGKQEPGGRLGDLNLLAFMFHTVSELTEDFWRKALEMAGTRLLALLRPKMNSRLQLPVRRQRQRHAHGVPDAICSRS
jgi:hypothetical protein